MGPFEKSAGKHVEKSKSRTVPRLLDCRIDDAVRRADELTTMSRMEVHRAQRLLENSRKGVASSRQRVTASRQARGKAQSLRERA
jgi:hypothetical protein